MLLRILALAIFFVLSSTSAYAEVKTIEADGMYIVGDGTNENPAVAKERAREDAKRAASEKAGVYVESLSEVRNGILTEDVIRTISANVMQIQKSDVKVKVVDNDALVFTCHIVATVDSNMVTAQLKQDGQELAEAARRNKELEDQLNKINVELAALKDQYAEATGEVEKEKIRQQVKVNEQQFQAGQLIEQGNGFMREKNFNSALKCYQDALLIYADDAVIYYLLGDAYRELKNYDAAVANYRKSLQINPNYSDAYNNLGFTLEQLGDYTEAGNDYRKAVECDPNYANAYYNLGNSFYRNGEYQAAVDSYIKAVSINKGYTLAYNNLGLAYERLDNYDKALESFTQAIENSADKNAKELSRVYNNRGGCYQMMQRFDEALNDYKRAAEIDPSYDEPIINRDRLMEWLNH